MGATFHTAILRGNTTLRLFGDHAHRALVAVRSFFELKRRDGVDDVLHLISRWNWIAIRVHVLVLLVVLVFTREGLVRELVQQFFIAVHVWVLLVVRLTVPAD